MWGVLSLLYAAAIGCVASAWLGMHHFSLSPCGQGSGWPQLYTVTDSLGIFALGGLGPCALILFLIVAGNVFAARKTLRPAIRILLGLAHAALFSAFAGISYGWGGYDLLRCGVLGCVDGVIDMDSR